MLENYEHQLRIANEFAQNIEQQIKERYQPAVNAVRDIHLKLEKESLRISQKFQPLKNFFEGEMIIDDLSYKPDKIVHFSNSDMLESLSNITLSTAGLFGILEELGDMTKINMDISSRFILNKTSLKLSKIREFYKLYEKELDREYTNTSEAMKEFGLKEIAIGGIPDPNKSYSIVPYLSLPIVRIWPAYGIATFVHKKIKKSPLIKNELEIISTLDGLNYSVHSCTKIEKILRFERKRGENLFLQDRED